MYDYLIRVNVYVKQEDVIYLRSINVEDLEKKIEGFINMKTDSNSTTAMVRLIPCIALYNSMDIDFNDYGYDEEDEDEDYDYDEEDEEYEDEDNDIFDWITDKELEAFFLKLLPIKFKGVIFSDMEENMYSSDEIK